MSGLFSGSLRSRLKLAWLAFRRPGLVGPAITINRAILIAGASRGTLEIEYDSGAARQITYTVTADTSKGGGR